MKKLLFLIFILCSGMSSIEIEASVNVMLINQADSSYDEEEEPRNPLRPGRRSAPVPVLCVIDFDNNTISGDAILNEITGYQIWDNQGACCLSAAQDAATFVEDLKTLPFPSTYMIVLTDGSTSLVGFIDME